MSGQFLASSAIRCCFVDTVSGLGVPVMFPSNGSCDGVSFPPRGPFGVVPPIHRYYEALRLPAVLAFSPFFGPPDKGDCLGHPNVNLRTSRCLLMSSPPVAGCAELFRRRVIE